MNVKRIEDWKIVPVNGGGVCLVGAVNGVTTQSSNIVAARAGEVKTEKSIYSLGQELPGMWRVQLQLKRPEKYKALQDNGVL